MSIGKKDKNGNKYYTFKDIPKTALKGENFSH